MEELELVSKIQFKYGFDSQSIFKEIFTIQKNEKKPSFCLKKCVEKGWTYKRDSVFLNSFKIEYNVCLSPILSGKK